jgi:hypothetical protein
MGIEEEDEPAHAMVGYVDFLTAPIDECLIDTLDSLSGDTAAFCELLSGGDVSDEVAAQFPDVFSGILVLDRAFVHPVLRGHNLGAWAVSQVIRHMTFASDSLVVTMPSPTETRPGMPEKVGARQLAKHWRTVGLETIKAAPRLSGQSTWMDDLEAARGALAGVADVEVTVTVDDVRAVDVTMWDDSRP